MRLALRSLFVVFGAIIAALAPAISVVHRWMIMEPRQRTSVLLRKVKGIRGAGAMFRQNRPSFASAMGLAGSIALASFGFIAVLALAGGLSLLALHPPTLHAAQPEHVALGVVGATFAEQLRDADGKVKAKHDLIESIFTAGGKDNDWSKPEVLKLANNAKDSAAVVEFVQAANRELKDLVGEREKVQGLAQIEEEQQQRKNKPARELPFPGKYKSERGEEEREQKTFGQVVMESKAVGDWKGERRGPTESLEKEHGLKTLFETGAGWAPASPRSDIVIPKAVRPIQVLDLLPKGTMEGASFTYMEETTATNNAAERSEGGDYAESAFLMAERTVTARSIGTSLPVTDEQLEDVPAAQSYLDGRLRFGVLQRLDQQAILGNGTPPNLQGLKTLSGVGTQSGAGITRTDTLLKAMTKVRVTGRAIPTAHILHPTDAEAIFLEKTLDGIYIFGHPALANQSTIWGLPFALCDADAAGIAYTGDFLNFVQLFERKGLEVAVGYVDTQFKTGKKTIRAGVRVALAWYRAAAFVKSTF